MAQVKETYLSDESSEDDDAESFQNDYEPQHRASFSDYETNRASLSDLESNRQSFSEHEAPLSDPESTKEFTEFNDNNQLQSESNSEEESRPYFQLPPVRTEKVTFHKFGQPTKVVHKHAPVFSQYASKRTLSCSDSEDQEEPPQPKRSKYDNLAKPATTEVQNMDKAKAMMEKMGYREGKGLGKNAQGRVAPVELSKQRGRRGLGLTVPGLEPGNLVWDSSMEVVQVEEIPTWLKGEHLPALDMVTLQSWIEVGPRNMNIEECTDFCDPTVLSEIISKKSIFDSLEGDEMRRARTRSNPFETIGKGIFLNRAAMKMANLDRVFDNMFTSPKTKDGEPMVPKDKLLYFADVCAGPGGFSEYVLWRKKWRAKGFGFTLKGENDFKLSDFFSGPCESFEPFYGSKGDGDVFDPGNIESLMHFVMDNTQQEGVHFMMADGGFSVDGQENIQELLSKQLYLCQFLVALCIVRTGGHFVCKLFDIFSPFSVGLVYLMYRAFDQISIHKPNTSRPANSERYIICKWKRDDCEPTREYLFNLNKHLSRLGSNSKDDINHCVSMDELTQDREFYNYIYESNNILGDRQVVNLLKIAAFCRDMNLTELRQSQMKRECLKYWNVPDQTRRVDSRTPEEIVNKRLLSNNQECLKSEPIFLRKMKDLQQFKSIFDWQCMPVGNQTDIYFFIGLGRNRVYRLTANGKNWKKTEATNLELSPGTMVYGEMVQEYQGEHRSQVKRMAFHIIDAISLGDEDVSHLHYTERLKICELFTESLNKSSRKDLCTLRAKTVYPLESLNRLFEGLTVYVMKTGHSELLLNTKDTAFHPKGVLFFRATKDPWMRCLSKTHNQCYYYCPGHDSVFDNHRPKDACASTMECIAKRLAWWWETGVGMKKEDPVENVLHKDQLMQFIRDRLGKR